MKKQITIIISILILISCNTSEKLERKNIYLQDKIDNYWSKKDFEQRKTINQKNKVIDSLKKIVNSSKKPLELATNIILNKDSLSLAVYDYINFNHEQKYNSILWDLSNLTNRNRNPQNSYDIEELISTDNTSYLLKYLWTKSDRSPQRIDNFFSEENKKFIINLLGTKNIYNKSGLSNLVNALIISYDEIGKNNTLLNELYKRSDSIKPFYDEFYVGVISEEVKDLLSENYSEDPWIEGFTRYSWVYSFWVRRNNEGNKETVYQIIKEFDNEMRKYKYSEENTDEDDYYEEGF